MFTGGKRVLFEPEMLRKRVFYIYFFSVDPIHIPAIFARRLLQDTIGHAVLLDLVKTCVNTDLSDDQALSEVKIP